MSAIVSRQWSDISESAEALESLAVGVLTLDARGEVMLANGMARSLFAPLSPTGLSLANLFSLSGVTNGGELIESLNAGDARSFIRIGLAGGRQLDCKRAARSGGGAIVTMVEVTSYVRDAELAVKDPLTGLINRAGLQERLETALAIARRKGGSLALLCIDLDRFKTVNDTLGHPVGDALLTKVAERLRGAIRKGDCVARLGGDEFVVLQADPKQPHSAEILAQRLVDLVGRAYLIDGHMINIGASIGIALSPHDGDDPMLLMRHADLALYRAKADGRGTLRFFQASMNAEVQARRQLEISLRRALPMKEFELVYQPQINLQGDHVTGFEALLRWRSADRGLVSPADFIPLAEEIGLITPIGAWVVRTACQTAASWPKPLSIAVNVSPAQFRDPNLVQTVEAALAASGLDPQRLELEITEGTLLENTDKVLDVLNRFKQMGIKIAMDDFGTGYSSLSYLQKFPFDKIKIDGTFVRGVHGPDGLAIVKAVAALGISLGMKTTAEGVETEEQLARIKADGCSEVQGYFTGRPLAAQAAMALVEQSQ